MINEQVLSTYDGVRAALAALPSRLERELRELLAKEGIVVQFVSSRLKSRESLREKIARPEKTYRSLWDVTDLVGLRIATYFEDAIHDVARLIERTYQVDFKHSTDKLRKTDATSFGYRSLHYVCALPGSGLDPTFRFEIQVRTALQHAWAEVEHDLGYKVDSVPAALRRRFSRVASLLEIADEEFVSIRRELAAYQRSLTEQVKDAQQHVPIDPLSLEVVARSPEVAALDEDVAAALRRPRSNALYYPEYLSRLLDLAGIGTTSQLRDAIARHGPAVRDVVRPYFEFSAKTYDFGADSISAVHAGYSLFFLAHLAILRGPELRLNKVARLTAVYAELDEGDARSPHDVATALIASLSSD